MTWNNQPNTVLQKFLLLKNWMDSYSSTIFSRESMHVMCVSVRNQFKCSLRRRAALTLIRHNSTQSEWYNVQYSKINAWHGDSDDGVCVVDALLSLRMLLLLIPRLHRNSCPLYSIPWRQARLTWNSTTCRMVSIRVRTFFWEIWPTVKKLEPFEISAWFTSARHIVALRRHVCQISRGRLPC